MSFSGKKYKRVSSENVEELIKAAKLPSDRAHVLLSSDSAFVFTRLDNDSYSYSLHFGERTITSTFKLGELSEMERRDGTKVKVLFHQPNDNVLSQVITDATGRTSNFKREFESNRCVLTISSSNSDIEAKITYEVVE